MSFIDLNGNPTDDLIPNTLSFLIDMLLANKFFGIGKMTVCDVVMLSEIIFNLTRESCMK